MENFIEEQTGAVLAIVQEIFNQPRAVIGQLEAWLRAEVADLEKRLKEKIQEVKTESPDVREKKRQLAVVGEGEERKSQKVSEEAVLEKEVVELETPPLLLENEDEQNKKRARDGEVEQVQGEVPFDDTGGSECFYNNCFGFSGNQVSVNIFARSAIAARFGFTQNAPGTQASCWRIQSTMVTPLH
jgi:hypothetical protein